MDKSVRLDQKEVAKAVAFWLENGCPEPKKPPRVYFTYDDPHKGNQFDHGEGVTARASID